MKSLPAYLAVLVGALLSLPQGRGETTAASELKPQLGAFASYQFGQPKKILHETRMAAYRNTADEDIRRQKEQLLLKFVESDATIDARREACLWLGNLGSAASEPVLKRLLADKDFSDVARIALKAVSDKHAGIAEFTTAQGAFEAEVMNSREPITLLTAAWQGEDEARSRHAFELVRRGVAAEAAAGWLAEHHSELSPQRQVAAMQLLLAGGSPNKITVIEGLSLHGQGEVRRQAVRNLGFLQREKDVPLLMELFHGPDEEMADAARQALLTLRPPLIRARLTRDLQSSEPATQSKAIELAEWTRADFTSEALLSISRDGGNPNHLAAARALGKAAPAEMLEEMIGLFIHAIGSELESPYKQALWDLARKQEDHQKAQLLLRTHAAKAQDKTAQKILEVFASRLDTLSTQKP